VIEDAIEQARSRLRLLKEEEEQTCKRSSITPAWFWLIVYETFYYTGIRLNALLNVRMGDIDLKHRLIRVRAETEKTHREFMIPIPDGLQPHQQTLIKAAKTQSFSKADQLFNVNRFSTYYI
jgi:integrase